MELKIPTKVRLKEPSDVRMETIEVRLCITMIQIIETKVRFPIISILIIISIIMILIIIPTIIKINKEKTKMNQKTV